jgi:GAF domain-containing protein
MSDRSPESKSSEALTAYFVGDLTVGAVLEKLCVAAIETIAPAVEAGLSMTVDARIGTYVFTHDEVQVIDRAQYATGDGPCVDAFRTGEVVYVSDTGGSGPYPEFRRVAADHGMKSVLSTPMSVGEQSVGALNLYSREADAFTGDDRAAARSFANQAGYVLLNHQAYWDARSLSENLQEAMRSRSTIEQAKGIIMATTSCSPDEAFERLREQSQQENVKLRDIAEEIVRRAQRGT